MIHHDSSLPDVRVLYSAKKPRGALLNYSPPNQYDLRALGRSSTSSVIEMSFEIPEIFVFIPSKLTKKNDLISFPFCSSGNRFRLSALDALSLRHSRQLVSCMKAMISRMPATSSG